ncbi:MAG: hypothetical protein ABW310_12025, partial [Acidimicrobiales bacterium]
ATARQKVVLDWIGGQCTRQGCGATRHLQVDHRIDWAHTHLTELRALGLALCALPPSQDPPGLGARRRHRPATDGAP